MSIHDLWIVIDLFQSFITIVFTSLTSTENNKQIKKQQKTCNQKQNFTGCESGSITEQAAAS